MTRSEVLLVNVYFTWKVTAAVQLSYLGVDDLRQ